MSHYTETSDTAARADSERDARHNGGDWPTGGYHWRPDYFRPPQALIFRASNYAWTYALLETPRDKMLSRLDRFKTRHFLSYHRTVKARRALYSPCYTGQPAPVMNIDPPKRSAA